MNLAAQLLTVMLLWSPASAQVLSPATAPTTSVATTQPTSRPVRPEPQIEHVLVISVDGLRPDLIFQADATNIQRLMKRGSFSLWARTTKQSITLPSHVSMMTGVVVETHHVTWNGDRPKDAPEWPAVRTLFDLAHEAGYSTALVSGKEKFEVFLKPGVVDASWLPKKSVTTDDEVIAHAVPVIRDTRPEVMLLHFPGSDSSGHGKGWSSPEQIAAIKHIDDCIGQALDAYRDAGLLDSTLIIVSADHGGTGRGHGPDDVRSRMIPWIASGPGVRINYDLTRIGKDFDVQTFDTFATACYVLGLQPDGPIDGKPIVQIFQDAELMQSAATPGLSSTQPATTQSTTAPTTAP
ncbi:MAG: ectonucleotide pyrophosphatase/phosphodiesterase [Tepidisphaeraceae bacterium]